MSQPKTPQPIEIDNELTICPECDYTNGFHVSFVRDEDGKLKIVLLCPSCSAAFDIGWTTL